MSENNTESEERTELADERTDLAEDRTIMANERTFAGWMRTGMACVGIGIGFNALFGKLEPEWLGRAIATVFIIIGIFIFYAARRNACALYGRLESHSAEPLNSSNFNLVSGTLAAASIALIIGLWVMKTPT